MGVGWIFLIGSLNLLKNHENHLRIMRIVKNCLTITRIIENYEIFRLI